MKQVLFLTGAAATGKTSIINSIIEKRPDIKLQLSISRGFYAIKGIKNEIEFQTLNIEDKRQFQLDMLEYYCDTTLKFIEENYKSTDLILIDRAPLDHLAWCLYNIPGLTMNEYKKVETNIHEFYASVSGLAETSLVFTPFPCHWTKNENQSSDGFRYDVFGKNLVLNHLIAGLINDYEAHFSNYLYVPDHITGLTHTKQLSPSDRADYILKCVGSINDRITK